MAKRSENTDFETAKAQPFSMSWLQKWKLRMMSLSLGLSQCRQNSETGQSQILITTNNAEKRAI